VRFLSGEWLAAVDRALAASREVAAATGTTSLRLLQVVTGAPDTPDGAVAEPGDGADVTLTSDWPTAVAIATGALAPHDAFTDGRLRVRGDIDVLRAQAPALAGLHAAFDEVRATTTY
jgi:putative sterol carrier protein